MLRLLIYDAQQVTRASGGVHAVSVCCLLLTDDSICGVLPLNAHRRWVVLAIGVVLAAKGGAFRLRVGCRCTRVVLVGAAVSFALVPVLAVNASPAAAASPSISGVAPVEQWGGSGPEGTVSGVGDDPQNNVWIFWEGENGGVPPCAATAYLDLAVAPESRRLQ